jgi:hypothetical protein
MTKHTPTPWHIERGTGGSEMICGADGWPPVGSSVASDDAALIVRAVNSHDELVTALRNLCDVVERTPGSQLTRPLQEALSALAKLRDAESVKTTGDA